MTMTEVTFAVLDVAPEPYAVTPVLTARVGIAAVGDDPVHAIALRCQVRIEPLRRGYSDDEAAGLLDLFGPRERWSTTQRTFLWQHSTAMVPGFSGATQVDLPLECTYDFEVAAAKYLHALRDGTIRLQFLFSGTVFTQGARGFAVQQVPWDREDRYDMPVAVWRRADRSSTTRTPGGFGFVTTPSTSWPPTSRSAACSDSTTPSRRCFGQHHRGDPMSAGWDRARAVADAVLYEGYLLYPYRANSRKNQSRWQFGVLGPQRCGRRGHRRGRLAVGADSR